jgi:hypothetical protein
MPRPFLHQRNRSQGSKANVSLVSLTDSSYQNLMSHVWLSRSDWRHIIYLYIYIYEREIEEANRQRDTKMHTRIQNSKTKQQRTHAHTNYVNNPARDIHASFNWSNAINKSVGHIAVINEVCCTNSGHVLRHATASCHLKRLCTTRRVKSDARHNDKPYCTLLFSMCQATFGSTVLL